MKKLTYILLITFFGVSCTSKTIYKKPDNLISEEKMIDIWTDIYLARGARTVQTKDLKNNINYLPLVFEKYNIDSAQLSESNRYYTSKIDDYQKMFEAVKKRLEDEKKKYLPKTDSLIDINRDKIK
ncbi:DUF4296 domain-containing protein [Aureibaculum marinum]|uniref:DUF4296 domain-containing protein n=1 Tax=Aureibaculum marinum TaxID=2487930 RepID=A0A3N4NPS3_9FLAO|nr:DUF4296 domain-containing protein [Aureibaculum marinum]RPD96518.1 DUF4296 domain-containing protein [Aureibaculum marinum]